MDIPSTIEDWYEGYDPGGGSSLPDVSGADNMSALQVVNGDWAKGVKLFSNTPVIETFLETEYETVQGEAGVWGVLSEDPDLVLWQGYDYIVTMNGESYNVTGKYDDNWNSYLGELSGDDPDLTNYPFFINLTGGSTYLCTETAETGEINIEIIKAPIDVNSQFKQAVAYSSSAIKSVGYDNEHGVDWYDKTWQEVWDAFNAGTPCGVIYHDGQGIGDVVVYANVYKVADDDGYYIVAYDNYADNRLQLVADSANGYLHTIFD